MVTLQSVQGHAGITNHFSFFNILGSLALSSEHQTAQNVKKIKRVG